MYVFSAYVADVGVVIRVRTLLQMAHSEGHTEVVWQLDSAGVYSDESVYKGTLTQGGRDDGRPL